MKLIDTCAFCGSREIKRLESGMCYCYNCKKYRHITGHFVDSNIIDKIRTKFDKLIDRRMKL